MPGQGRLGDKANVPLCAHGCPACPHPAVGPAIQGSPDVNVNRRPALRVDDPGVHMACCGTNTWTATRGCMTVFINNKAAHRMGDQNRHCGGMGQLVEGSPNVIVGESGGGGGGGGGGSGGGGSGGGGGGSGGGGGGGGGGAGGSGGGSAGAGAG
ncbi:MAG TPA: PAAR domain-containing protein, partial [Kofleriaceae bacterium]